jgi:hypothetical protein
MVASSSVLFAMVPAVIGHGGIVSPPARETTVALWFNEGCQVGCGSCKGHVSTAVASVDPYIFCFKRNQEPTLDLESELVTYPGLAFPASHKYNPWYAPGFAPVFSPCGLAAGQANGSYPENGDVAPPGFTPGFDGRDLNQTIATVWPVGSIQEVVWSIEANHGGGYAVRLCPFDEEASEDCFQQHHLPFHGDSSWIRLGGSDERVEIKANRTTTGTHPSGSQWTKVPIPSCGGAAGGGLGCDAGCAEPQFPSPVPGVWGNGPGNGCAGCDPDADSPRMQPVCMKEMDYEIIDKVKVPDLQPGRYVLSFRWDCEQTPQIWSQCSDIEITASEFTV